ncbi:hypothetical protein E2C01_032861 [Portunus trituberculatus]|uniref:Uncharacterized protein n=1 Tax=Portunus trituberculatus TaxID=210409 RepID=A0A5B7F271_PORTR|nr:hypothetical protein [Portunus trituberculatus]
MFPRMGLRAMNPRTAATICIFSVGSQHVSFTHKLQLFIGTGVTFLHTGNPLVTPRTRGGPLHTKLRHVTPLPAHPLVTGIGSLTSVGRNSKLNYMVPADSTPTALQAFSHVCRHGNHCSNLGPLQGYHRSPF